MNNPNELVSVIIAAFNANETISQTLTSVSAQTHDNLEIIVVDDGSTDATPTIVAGHARRDPRIRLICQDNAGPASARNRALAEARGRFIAPIDADDLWRRNKIERQLEAMRANEQVGLVYTWYIGINVRDNSVWHRSPTEEGDVFLRLIDINFVGNGSSSLLRAQAVREVGGYDSSIPHGCCEDLKLYLEIAERYRFAVVKEYLTGYRIRSEGLSSKGLRMLVAYDHVMAGYRERYPQLKDEFHAGRNAMLEWLILRALREAKRPQAIALLGALLRHDPRHASHLLTHVLPTLALRKIIKMSGVPASSRQQSIARPAGELFS